MSKYVFVGQIENSFGQVIWRNCSMTTYAQSFRKALTNIKYNVRKKMGYEKWVKLKATGEIRSGEEVCEIYNE